MNDPIVALAFNTAPLGGWRVRQATLVCHQGAETISGVTISTIAVPWDEHTATALTAGRDGLVGWGYPGARFPAVCGGNAGTLVHEAAGLAGDGRHRWDVPPDMVHALALGVAHGLAIHEHDADDGRNPTIFSREQSGKRPVLVVDVADGPPDPISTAPPRSSGRVAAAPVTRAAAGARKSTLDMRLHSGRRMDNRRYDDIAAGATRGFWDDFAAAFGPVLDGSLFTDGHRGPVPVPESNRTLVAWALDAWTAGASGLVPWQTIDRTGRALTEADQLGLFIFDRDAEGRTAIRHSLRLKAFREAQQLIEHLRLLEARLGWTEEETRSFVLHHVALDGGVRQAGAEDAGTPVFTRLPPAPFDRLRQATIDLLRTAPPAG